MYKAITLFWSKSSTNKTRSSSEPILDEASWVFVSNAGKYSSLSLISSKKIFIQIETPAMSTSWIATPPLVKSDQSSEHVHHLNPIENLLIEHASKSEKILYGMIIRDICRYECL